MPALTFTRIPCAPARLMSSRSGEETAASAAARARPSPLAAPDPIIAMPVSAITVRTSAKSTLMRPGRVMSSAMPCTAPCNTWFADLKASRSVVCGPNTVNSFWLGIVMSESQNLDSSPMPWSATQARLLPSISNGVAAATTHADHLDDSALAVCVHQFKHGYRSLHEYKRLVGSRSSLCQLQKLPWNQERMRSNTDLALPPRECPRCAGRTLSRA